MKNKTNKKQDMNFLFNNSSSRSLFHSRLIVGPYIIVVEIMMMKIHVVVLLLLRSCSCCNSFSSTLFGTYCWCEYSFCIRPCVRASLIEWLHFIVLSCCCCCGSAAGRRPTSMLTDSISSSSSLPLPSPPLLFNVELTQTAVPLLQTIDERRIE